MLGRFVLTIKAYSANLGPGLIQTGSVLLHRDSMITGPLLCLREIKSGASIVKKTIRIIYLQRLIARI